MYWKCSNPNRNRNRRDEMTLKTTCIKHVKFKIIKIGTSSQYIGNFFYCENLKWAAQNLQLSHMRPMGRGLDIADLGIPYFVIENQDASEQQALSVGQVFVAVKKWESCIYFQRKLHLCAWSCIYAHIWLRKTWHNLFSFAWTWPKVKIFCSSTSKWVRALSYLAGVVKLLACKPMRRS